MCILIRVPIYMICVCINDQTVLPACIRTDAQGREAAEHRGQDHVQVSHLASVSLFGHPRPIRGFPELMRSPRPVPESRRSHFRKGMNCHVPGLDPRLSKDSFLYLRNKTDIV